MLNLLPIAIGTAIVVGLVIIFVEVVIGEWPPGYQYNKMVKNSTNPTISFEMFQSLYNMTPDNWRLCSDNITYIYKNKDDYYHNCEDILFETYKDFKQYQAWYVNHTFQLRKKNKNKAQEKYLKLWQKDIDEYRKRVRQETSNEFTKLYEYCKEIGCSQEVLDIITKSKGVFDK